MPEKKKHRLRNIVLIVIALLLAGALAGRFYLPIWLKDYVNAQINSIKGYNGGVDDIDVHLWRGAYTIHKLKINKTGSGMPVPFVSIDTTDLSIQWSALWHGRVVAEIDTIRPVLNFAENKAGTDIQTGSGVNWTEQIKKLAPIDINHVTARDGKIYYRNYSTSPEVNIYITNMSGEITNLRNVEDKANPLPSKLTIKGKSIGGGTLNISGAMNILKKVPDMKIGAKLEHVKLPALNDYFMAFAFLDVEKGTFDLYSEVNVKNGALSGYVKPLARHIELINLKRDSNPVKLLWESIASVVIEVFSNQRKDQFATVVPLSGNIENVKTNTFETIIGILRNAFIEGLSRGLNSARG